MQPGPGGLCSGQPGPGGLWSVLWEAWSRSVVVCAPGSPVQERRGLCSGQPGSGGPCSVQPSQEMLHLFRLQKRCCFEQKEMQSRHH